MHFISKSRDRALLLLNDQENGHKCGAVQSSDNGRKHMARVTHTGEEKQAVVNILPKKSMKQKTYFNHNNFMEFGIVILMLFPPLL